MNAKYVIVLALAASATGCDRAEPAKSADLAAALPDVYLPSRFSFVSRSGGEDALQITVRTPDKPDAVANYYRGLLTRDPWRIESDTKDREGVVTLYATRKGPPMWVRISPDTAFNATLVQLSGALVKDLPLDNVVGEQIPFTAGQNPK
jgi:hypothetical protein